CARDWLGGYGLDSW
nr:immunoglobulin heavy chain junction region [Macaca mulatta]